MQNHLVRCLKSSLSQTYSDFELILVDDGSTDFSAEICEQFALNDSKVIVFHQNNRGVANAKNLGINASSGEYICFSDSDDYIERDYLECLYKNINLADWVISGVKYLSPDENNIYNQMNLQRNYMVMREEYLDKIWELLDKDGLNYHVSKLYKTGIVMKNRIRFTDFRRTGADDTVFNFDYLEYTNSISIVNKNIYNYISYSGSTSKKYDINKWERGKLLDEIITQKSINMGIYSEDIQRIFDKRICMLVNWICCEIATLNLSIKKRITLIKAVSKDERFLKAYKNRTISDNDKNLNLLYHQKILLFIIKKFFSKLRGKISRLFPTWTKKIYKKWKKDIKRILK